MSTSFGFFEDAGLTIPFTGNLIIQQADDGSTGPVDAVLYLGSNSTGTKIQAVALPGVLPININVNDSAPGSGQSTLAVRLATTQLGLDSATPGNALGIGTTLNSEPGNSQAVWARIEATDFAIGNYVDLSLRTNEVQESAV